MISREWHNPWEGMTGDQVTMKQLAELASVDPERAGLLGAQFLRDRRHGDADDVPLSALDIENEWNRADRRLDETIERRR